MKIGIISCDYDKNLETNGSQLIKNHIKTLNVDEIIIWNAYENLPKLTDINSCDKIIITGSRASVYDNTHWVKEMIELVKKITTPTLGICFGFQLIAESFGGKVKSSGEFKEGFNEINIVKKHKFLDGLSEKLKVYHSHGDVAVNLPKEAVIYAKNDFTNQIYEYKNFFLLQFHPEITPDIATKMAIRDNLDVEKILNGVNKTYRNPLIILKNFIHK